MSDLESKNGQVPANVLAKRGVAAVAQIAGGVFLLVVHIFSSGRAWPLGMVLGIIISIIGISSLLSKDKEAKKPGLILSVAGLTKLFCHIGPIVVRGLATTIFTVTSLGLLALGIINGIRFLSGLKNRN